MPNLNPHILPGRPVSKEEHRRSLTATVIISVLTVIIGLVYWWTLPKEVPVVEQPTNSNGFITLTPEELQLKKTQINQILSEKPVTLTPAQIKLKEQQIKTLTN